MCQIFTAGTSYHPLPNRARSGPSAERPTRRNARMWLQFARSRGERSLRGFSQRRNRAMRRTASSEFERESSKARTVMLGILVILQLCAQSRDGRSDSEGGRDLIERVACAALLVAVRSPSPLGTSRPSIFPLGVNTTRRLIPSCTQGPAPPLFLFLLVATARSRSLSGDSDCRARRAVAIHASLAIRAS